jgi:hypothetical protein
MRGTDQANVDSNRFEGDGCLNGLRRRRHRHVRRERETVKGCKRARTGCEQELLIFHIFEVASSGFLPSLQKYGPKRRRRNHVEASSAVFRAVRTEAPTILNNVIIQLSLPYGV